MNKIHLINEDVLTINEDGKSFQIVAPDHQVLLWAEAEINKPQGFLEKLDRFASLGARNYKYTIKNHYRLYPGVATTTTGTELFAEALICCLYFHALVRIWITSRLVKVTAIYMSNPLTQRNH